MPEHYTDIESLQRRLAITFSDTSRPSVDDVEGILTDVDGMINGRLGNETGTNYTDSTGDLKRLANEKAIQMVNNLMYFTDPANYSLIPIEWSKEEVRTIHKITNLWSGDTFDIGD